MQKYIFLLLALITSIIAQPGREGGQIMRPVTVDHFVTNGDSTNTCNVFFKISYSSLVFSKTGEQYISKINFAVEIKDTILNNILREYTEKEIILNDFESTQAKDKFAVGILKLDIGKGIYKVLPSVLSDRGNPLARVMPFTVDNRNPNISFLKPLILDGDLIEYQNNTYQKLLNSSKFIPFTHKGLNLVFPVYDKDVNEITIRFIQDKEKIFEQKIDKFTQAYLAFKDCQEIIGLDTTSGKPVKYFVIENFNTKLKEGPLRIIVNPDSENKLEKNYTVLWIDKPMSLKNYDTAEAALKVIDQLEEFSKQNKEDEYSDIFVFWKKFDPTPDTEFNELMEEFYRRVDHGIKEFVSQKKRAPLITDRAKVYIKYGAPDETVRDYNKRNETIEIWYYYKLDRTIYFKDITGRGDFELVN